MTKLTLAEARKLAVAGQLLDAPRPRSILKVVEWLGSLQMDPTSAVARSERLVLWSRLGNYDLGELERLRWETRELFDYWAHIVPAADYGIHRETMRRYPGEVYARWNYIREWVAANSGFRRYVLRELRRRGPLRTKDLEDRAAVPWKTSGGWNDGKSLGVMLEILWDSGKVGIARREGNERLWDLAERVFPTEQPRLSAREIARRLVDTQLRGRGVARHDELGRGFGGWAPGRERALAALIREGRAVPVEIDGLAGDWLAHAELLERGPGEPRSTLLSPFDKLVYYRDRTEELFGFRFRLEIYVPKAKREYGYFVLPFLHGHELVGRIDPLFDRKTGVLRINAVHWEPGAPKSARPALKTAVAELAEWLGATEIAYAKPM
jgi:uncharacterized protein YcaQ